MLDFLDEDVILTTICRFKPKPEELLPVSYFGNGFSRQRHY